MTGEEGETTIHKVMGKVFFFDSETKSWKERGRGTLKVNYKSIPDPENQDNKDDQENQTDQPPQKKTSARLIMRTEGTYVVILNTPIYEAMNLGKEPTGNSVTLLAMDGGSVVTTTIRVSFLLSRRRREYESGMDRWLIIYR
jgi:Ran-binding protein 3